MKVEFIKAIIKRLTIFGSWFLLATLLVTYLLTMIFIHKHFGFMSTDASLYSLLGKNLASGHGYELYGVPHVVFSPLLPLLTALLLKSGFSLELAAQAATWACAIGIVGAVYCLSKEIVNKKIGLLAATIYALFGSVIWSFSVIPTAQAVAGLAAVISSIFLIKAFKKITYLNAATLGLFLGLAYLARPEYLIMAFFSFIVLLFADRTKKYWRQLLSFTIFLSLFFCYAGYSYSQSGSLIGRTNEAIEIAINGLDALNNDMIVNQQISPLISPLKIDESLNKLVFNKFSTILKRLVDGLLNIERNVFSQLGFLGTGLIFLGMFCYYDILKKHYLLTALIGLSPIVAVAIFQGGSINYIVQYFYLLPLPMALGARHVYVNQYINGKIIHKLFLIIASLFFVGYLLLTVIQNILFLPKDYRPLEIKETGVWLEKIGAGKNVASRKPEINFYADSIWFELSDYNNPEQFVGFLKRNKIDYVFVDDRDSAKLVPALYSLIMKNDLEQVLRPIYETSFGRYKARIYKVISNNL
jgi:hypothetical protein